MADGNEVKKPGDFGKDHGINKMPIRDGYEKELRKEKFVGDELHNFPDTLKENFKR